MVNRITEAELVDELRHLADDVGPSPTMDDMDKMGEYAPSTYSRRFGSWNNALKEAGLDPSTYHSSPDQEVLEELADLAERLGKTPTWHEILHDDNSPAPTLYQGRFGSLAAAAEKAGLKSRQTSEELGIPTRDISPPSKEKAYIIGVLLSDGSISSDNFRLNVVDEEFAQSAKRSYESWTGLQPRLWVREKEAENHQDQFVVEKRSKEVANELDKYNPEKWAIWVNEFSKDALAEMVRGLYEGDGNIDIHHNRVEFTNSVDHIAHLFAYLAAKITCPKHVHLRYDSPNNAYRVGLGKDRSKEFIDRIDPVIARKRSLAT